MYDILGDVATKWESLTANEKAYVANASAGQRQYSVFETMMEGWGKSTDLATKALNSNGTALNLQKTYMESTEAKIKTFNSTVTSMWQGFISSTFLGNIVQLGTYLVQHIVPVLTTIIGIITIIKAQSIQSFVAGIGSSISNIGTQLGFFYETMMEAGGGVKGFATALDTLSLSEATVTGGIGLLITAISLISIGMSSYNQAQEQAIQTSVDASNKYKSESSSLSELISQYQEIESHTSKTADDKTNLKSIQDQLISTYGEEAKNLDLVNGKYDDQIAKLKEVSKAKADEYLRENQDPYNKAQNALVNDSNSVISKGKNYSAYQSLIDLDREGNNRLFSGTGLENDSGITGNLSERVKILGDIVDRSSKINNLTDNEKTLVSWVSNEYKTLKKQLDDAKSIVDQMNQATLKSKFSTQMSQMTNDAQKFQTALKSGDVSGQQEAISDFQKLNTVIENTTGLSPSLKQAFQDWVKGLNSFDASTQTTSGNANSTTTSLESLSKSFSDINTKITTLQSVQDSYNDVGYISADMLSKLAANNGELMQYVDVVNGKLVINSDKLTDSANKLKEQMITTEQASLATNIYGIIQDDMSAKTF